MARNVDNLASFTAVVSLTERENYCRPAHAAIVF